MLLFPTLIETHSHFPTHSLRILGELEATICIFHFYYDIKMQYKVWIIRGGKRTSFPHLWTNDVPLRARNQVGRTLHAQGGNFANQKAQTVMRWSSTSICGLADYQCSMNCAGWSTSKDCSSQLHDGDWARIVRHHNRVHLCAPNPNPSPCTLQMKKAERQSQQLQEISLSSMRNLLEFRCSSARVITTVSKSCLTYPNPTPENCR